jgi:hypothetical protein
MIIDKGEVIIEGETWRWFIDRVDMVTHQDPNLSRFYPVVKRPDGTEEKLSHHSSHKSAAMAIKAFLNDLPA